MDRCPSCNHECRYASPTGPVPATVMAIGEKPGRQEANFERVFIGDTGKELDGLYLPLAGLDRDEVRVTNTVKCWLGFNNDKPTPEQVRSCGMHHLPAEVAACSPEVIILLGSTACSLVPKIELDKDHGLPVWVDPGEVEFFGQWGGWVWPSYHPASALHDTGMMIPLVDDFERFRKWRRGKWRMPQPITSQPDYALIETANELIDDFCCGDFVYPWLPIDTENDGPRPWSLQYSIRPGHGRMILAEHKHLLKLWHELAEGWEAYYFQNANHDIDIMEEMGVLWPEKQFWDTMQEAYHLGNLPQGLKALSWRLLGIRMRSWEDVVLPPSREKMIAWLLEQYVDSESKRVRIDHMYARPKSPTAKKLPDCPIYDDGGLIVGRYELKPSDLERALNRILSHSHKPEYDLWDKVAEVEGLSGWPIKSIAHVPTEEAIFYACQDADVTGQVASILAQCRKEVMAGEWQISEEDADQ